MTHLIDLPEDVAQRAAMLVASGRFASVEDAVRAGMEAIVEIAEDERAASRGRLVRVPRPGSQRPP